ncbi:MAG TPA: Ig-like domain-containing protein, partial [bacterium]|nr:Ig-like domain-containing protein [bacterium]
EAVHPDLSDAVLQVQFSTVSISGPWQNATLSTTTVLAFLSSDTGDMLLEPPGIHNENDFQVGVSSDAVETSSGTIKLILNWLTREDLPGYEGFFWLKADIRDFSGIYAPFPDVSDIKAMDNLEPAILSFSYRYGENGFFSQGSSAHLEIRFTESVSTPSFSEGNFMLLPGADAFSEGLEIEEAEREPGVTGDLLSFYLNEEKWDRLARWDEENRSIYLYLSSGSYITDNSFNLFQGTAAPVSVWQKDEEECFIAEALYAMQADGRPGLTLTFNEKIAEGSLSTQSVRSIRILREKTGTSPFLDFDFDVEIASKSSSQFLITVPDEKHVELVTWQTEPLYLLVREASLCRDYSGNSCRVLSTAQALIVPFQNDVISPEIAWYLPTSTSIVKVGDLQILVKFGEKLLETSWPGALNVYEYKDSMGDSVLLKSVAGTLDYDDGEFLLSFVADEKLQNGYTYLVVISTGIRDISANAILQPFEWEFTVLRDFTTDNVVYYPQENVRVEISSGALSGDGKVEIRNS